MANPEGQTSSDLELRAAELTFREEEARRRFGLDSSFPKKWGSVLFSSVSAVFVASITAGFAWFSSYKENEITERIRIQESAATARQQMSVEAERKVANARLALEIYFSNIEKLKSPDEDSVNHFALIAGIAEKEEVRTIFLQMRQSVINERRASGAATTLAAAASGLASAPIQTSVMRVNSQFISTRRSDVKKIPEKLKLF